MRAVAAIGVCLAALGVAGCGQIMRTNPASSSPAPVADVDVVVADAAPTAAHWDNLPGADGIRVRVTLYRADRPQPVVGEGALDFLLFLGKTGDVDLSKAEPFQIWSYTAPELRPALVRNIVGWGYMMSLAWGQHLPPSPTVMLLVRYRPPKGEPVYARPVTIMVSQP